MILVNGSMRVEERRTAECLFSRLDEQCGDLTCNRASRQDRPNYFVVRRNYSRVLVWPKSFSWPVCNKGDLS